VKYVFCGWEKITELDSCRLAALHIKKKKMGQTDRDLYPSVPKKNL
jgi:hypothetical protein